jgi:outer membrane protein assembly factor BamB
MKKALGGIGLLLACVMVAFAGDWPMWRYDAARSAATPEGIATNPVRLWSRRLPPVRQAWPDEQDQRLNFDASYEPVVVGQRLFLGSPNDGSVTAYDTATGAEKWKFFTEGPVRCAPACWRGRVYAGSDDGYLYCLDGQSGNLLWKFRGAPPDRPDRRQLGNGHLVSFWPVRGGPVVVDGTVYLGAGIWPAFGVFLHALDAETGKVKWTNGNVHRLANVRIDHEYFGEAGLSPQGYLVASGDRLIVPCGRSLPAGLDLASGKLIYYAQGYRNGDSRVAAHGRFVFVGRNGVANADDMREAGSRWAGRGGTAPEGYSDRDPGLAESPAHAYKAVAGCDASSAFADGVAYGMANGTLYAYDLRRARTAEAEFEFFGKFKGLKWEPPLLWQFKTALPQAGGLAIKAGTRLYTPAGRKVLAVDLLGADARTAWEQDLDGTPSSLAAADGKLFVVTAEGSLHCFGAGSTGKTYAAEATPLEPRSDGWRGRARQIVSAAGVKAGYGLVLGLSEGRLIEELLTQTDLLILGVDADPVKIERVRRRLAAAGYLGGRVELFVGRPNEFLFPPYVASLIVSEDPLRGGFDDPAGAAATVNLLRPYGGTLCLPADAPRDPWLQSAIRAGATAKPQAGWAVLVRAGALPGAADWTHEAGDAARTFCSQDDAVQAPLGFLWYGDTIGYVLRNHNADRMRPQVVEGRVYGLSQRSRFVLLAAYDAYTGRPLWKTELQTRAGWHARFVAQPEGIYLLADGKCFVYDPATGNLRNTFVFNATGATTPKGVRAAGDVLVVACSEVKESELSDAYWNAAFYQASTLVCLDRKTGAALWRRSAQRSFKEAGLALGAGLVFCVDSADAVAPGTNAPKASVSTILALDPRTGGTVWSKQVTYPGEALQDPQEWLAFSEATGLLLCGRREWAHAFDAKSGAAAWTDKKILNGVPVVVRGKTFSDCCGLIYDVTTGLPVGNNRTVGIWLGGGYVCNQGIASRHLFLARTHSATYADIDRQKVYYLRNIRSGCVNSLIAAAGLLNAPNYAQGCICNYAIQTSFAMMTMPEVEAWAGAEPLAMTPPPAETTALTPGREQGR